MNDLSIRERAIRQLKLDCETMSTEVTTSEPGEPYPFEWSLVQRSPLDDRARGKSASLAILEGDERKVREIGYVICFLPVTLEFSVPVPPNAEAASYANLVLLAIQRRYREDPYLVENATNEQLVINTVEVANTIDVDSFQDKRIEGLVSLELEYRHAIDDPREFYGRP